MKKKFYELTVDNLKDYLLSIDFFKNIAQNDKIKITDISNGINAVFRIEFLQKTHDSFILKQALSTFRKRREQKLSQYRLDAEISAYDICHKHVPDLVPKVFFSSTSMKVIILEDLNDCDMLSDGLKKQIIYPKLSKDIAIFFSTILFKTSSFNLGSIERREINDIFNKNSNICQLTEYYVFTDRITHGKMFKNKKDVENQFFNDLMHTDKVLQKSILELKYKFMTQNDALLHGDFKGGALMVKESNTFVIDFEFSFIGPFGYDIGSFLYVLISSIVSCSQYDRDNSYIQWLYKVIEELYIYFEENFLKLWVNGNKSALISTELIDDIVIQEYKEDIVKQILQDSVGFAGVQISSVMISLLKLNDSMSFDEYLEKEAIYYRKMYNISTIFLKKYKSIDSVDSIIKIIKSME